MRLRASLPMSLPTAVRGVLVLLAMLGILMPKVSAAVATLAPSVETVVICTGDGLRTIRIDPDGSPVPISHHADHCLLTHAADTAVPAASRRVGATPVDTAVRPTGDLVRRSLPQSARPPPRAPPAT